MCRSRLWLLYWVSTAIRRIPALTRLDSAKSTSRYMPPNGTAGLARSAVSGASRLPAPPASTMPRTRLSAISHPSRAICFFQHAIQDLLRFFLDAGQLSGTGERLRVELVDVFCARGAGGEPAILGDHLDAAQRLAVARGPGQPVQHPLAREFADADLVRGELGQQGLLRPGRGRVDPGVRRVAELGGQVPVPLTRRLPGHGRDLRGQQGQDDAVLVCGPDLAVGTQERGAGALLAAEGDG